MANNIQVYEENQIDRRVLQQPRVLDILRRTGCQLNLLADILLRPLRRFMEEWRIIIQIEMRPRFQHPAIVNERLPAGIFINARIGVCARERNDNFLLLQFNYII